MSIANPLFEGKLIRLGQIDHEKDPEIISRWSNDAGFMRMMYLEPMRPLSQWQVKKKLEDLEKAIDEERNFYHFRIRSRQDDRLLGFAELYWITWANQAGFVRLGIGSAADRRQGYGSEALCLLLRYAFKELNLHCLCAVIPAYNLPAQALFTSFGFIEEVRRRKALQRDGQFWDILNFGLLAGEWKDEKDE